jgi:hypothetical protein
MSVTSDDRLAAQVARELSLPEPGVHFGATLVIATVVASPVLFAGVTGRQSVPEVLSLYVAVLIVVWFVGGIIGSALASSPRARVLPHDDVPPSTPGADDSVGSNSAH